MSYKVDIEVALRGSQSLKQLTNDLKQVSKQVGKVNAGVVKTGKKLDESFSGKKIENVNNYSKAVAKAGRALRNAAMDTDAERTAVRALVRAQKEFNEQLDRQNRLIKEERALQGVVDKSTARASKAPIGGGRAEKSEMFRQLFRDADIVRENIAAAKRKDLVGRVGAGVSAGAFPLLFGGGPGMALGGALGGAISGSTFGPASIALQVLGGAVDTYVAQLTDLAGSLRSTQDILSGLENAGYRVSDSTKSVINSYEEAGLFADAYAIALEEINRVLGPDGAAKLSAYNDETKKLQSEIEKVTASLQSELLPVFTGLIRVILGVKAAFDQFADSPLGNLFLQGTKQIAFTALPGLAGTEKVLEILKTLGAPTGEPGIPDSVRLAQENADFTSRTAQIEASQAAQERIYLIDAQNKAVQAGNNLLDERVVEARKNVIQEEYLAKMRKQGITDAEKTLIEREKTLALSRLNSQINAAEVAAQKQKTRELERQNTAADRLAKRQQRAIARRVAATDRELERTDRLFNRTSSQLDDIINRNKDKVAFEREYAELIRGGSTPAAAKQAIELKKQLLELDRRYEKELKALDAQLAKTELVILEAIAVDGVTDAIKKQIEEYNRLKDVRDGLAETKEGAEGAINEALAPKSDREVLDEYLKKLQEQLNDLMNPANQLIGLAETLGGAFSESFKGLVTGSMSAQQALANLFQRTADHFLDMAARMIAAQIQMKILGIGLSFFGGGGASTASSGLNIEGIQQYVNPFNSGDFTNAFSGKALGGAVGAGRPYMVGERGPELFVPGAQGNIVPNNAMGGSNIVVNVDASGSSVEGSADQAQQLGKAIGIAVQQELVKQKRPGGLLAS